MSDVSGIPNLGIPGMSGFSGGGAFAPGGSFGSWSADQINASMGYNPNAAAFNPWGGTTGGFGNMTDYYSGLGAAYGRNTGYYGDTLGLTPGQTTPAAQAANPWAGYSFDNSSYLSGLGQYQGGGGGGGWSFDDYGQPFQSAYPSAATNAPQSSYGYGLTGQGGLATYSDPWAGTQWATPGWDGGYSMPQFQMPAQQPQVDWSAAFNQITAPQSPYANNSGAVGGGGWSFDDYGNPYQSLGGWGQAPAAASNPWASLGYDPSTLYANAMGYPGGGVSSYFNPSSYGSYGMGVPAQTGTGGYSEATGWAGDPYAGTQWASGGGGGGGGWSFDDYGNPFQTGVGPTTSGLSNAPAYQGNPYYLPQSMQGGNPFQGGGGFGMGGGGFGLPGTGYMGMGMGIGTINGNGSQSVTPAFGAMSGGNPFGGSTGYGFGGLPPWLGSDLGGAIANEGVGGYQQSYDGM